MTSKIKSKFIVVHNFNKPMLVFQIMYFAQNVLKTFGILTSFSLEKNSENPDVTLINATYSGYSAAFLLCFFTQEFQHLPITPKSSGISTSHSRELE